MASTHSYSSLAQKDNTIRILRLLPSVNGNAPLECEIFESCLRSEGVTHPYEALSYVWGDPADTRSISLNGNHIYITTNLHVALLQLRNPFVERYLWVDAICINQKDSEEKEQQIQKMYQIFGYADRVLVWLGVAADASDQAFEYIRVSAEGQRSSSLTGVRQKAIFALLERSWFERIWVLQEVSAARAVLITCGSAEMDGYVFVSGLHHLRLRYKDQPGLEDLIRPTMYLIMGAIFRPRDPTHLPRQASLGELLDMYHTRKATERHDKIYALLSMSSESPQATRHLVNYKAPWTKIFELMIQFLLPKLLSVEIQHNITIALIKVEGHVIGQVVSVDRSPDRYDRQWVTVRFTNTPNSFKYIKSQETCLVLQATAKSVQQGDLICLFDGASRPSIIRTQKNHFTAVVIAMNPLPNGQYNNQFVSFLHLNRSLLRKFSLIWDWDNGTPNRGHSTSEKQIEAAVVPPDDDIAQPVQVDFLLNMAMILQDGGAYYDAETYLQQVEEQTPRTSADGEQVLLTCLESRAFISMKRKDWENAAEVLTAVFRTKQKILGSSHVDILSTVADLALVYISQCDQSIGTKSMDDLLIRIKERLLIQERQVIQLIKSSVVNLLTLIMDTGICAVGITEEVVKAAARNRERGKDIMNILLEQRGDEIKITEEVVKAVVGNGKCGKEIISLLLAQRGDEIKITEAVVKAAAGNRECGKEIMSLLLEQRIDQAEITDGFTIAIAKSFDYFICSILLERRGDGIKVTEEVVKAAAANRKSEIMSLLLEQRAGEIRITEGVVKAAVENEECGKEIISLLLEQRGDEIKITEEVVKATVGNREYGEEIISLLLKQRDNEVKITEEVVKSAIWNEKNGANMIRLLLEHRGDEIKITEEVVKAVENNGWRVLHIMRLLLIQRAEQAEITDGFTIIVARSGDESIFSSLLKKQGDKIKITEAVVTAAAENWKSGKEIIKLLFTQRAAQAEITDGFTIAIAKSFDESIFSLLLDQRGEEIKITEEVVKAAAENWNRGKEIISLFLKQHRAEVKITEEVVKAAARNGKSGKEIISFLLEHCGDEVKITEDVVKAVVGNEQSGKDIISLLFEQRKSEVKITEDVVKAAVGNEESGKDIMSLLFEQCKDEVKITEEVVRAAAGNGKSGKETMSLLLKQCRDEIKITEEVVKTAVANWDSGKEIISLLLKQYEEDEIKITEEVVKAAVGNRISGKDIMKLLLEQRRGEVKITEDVVKVAAGNEHTGIDIIGLLLEECGDEVKLTEEVVKTVAGNQSGGWEIMRFLLQQRGNEIKITEEVVKAAAGNEHSGIDIIDLLLEDCGDEVKITEEVVKTVAANRYGGLGIMRLLLEQRRSEIKITEEVVKAAAGNEQSGKDIMRLLLRS